MDPPSPAEANSCRHDLRDFFCILFTEFLAQSGDSVWTKHNHTTFKSYCRKADVTKLVHIDDILLYELLFVFIWISTITKFKSHLFARSPPSQASSTVHLGIHLGTALNSSISPSAWSWQEWTELEHLQTPRWARMEHYGSHLTQTSCI